MVKRINNRTVRKLVDQVDASEIRLLYHSGYYDGPLSGVCIYRGERLWFDCFFNGSRHRKFALYRVPDSTWVELDYQHQLFREYVGTNTDYNENGQREVGATPLIERNYDKFYSYAKQHPITIPKDQLIGWFKRDRGLV